jgi:Flp pilus assembly protein TadG
MKFFRDNRGTALVEFALVAMPVLVFLLGIMQTAWIVWIDNLLQVSVDTAARCGAVKSITSPCAGLDMVTTANQVFQPLSGAGFISNGSCANGDTNKGVGLVGTYTINLALVVDLTVTAKSCYPVIS